MDPLKAVSPSAASKKALSLVEEFKNFAFKGNVIDLAVGVIIGAAFGGIIKSLVDNVMMPLIGAALPGEQGYKGWAATLNGKAIPYGLLLPFPYPTGSPTMFPGRISWEVDREQGEAEAEDGQGEVELGGQLRPPE
jgi:hypothetical protein